MTLKQGLIIYYNETYYNKSRFDQLQKGIMDKIVDYFITIKDKIQVEQLQIY